MIDLKAELRRRVQALYEIGLDFLSEEEAERKRRAREPHIEFEVIRPLTEEDLRRRGSRPFLLHHEARARKARTCSKS